LRVFVSLLKASVIAAAVFTIAWIRLPFAEVNLRALIALFVLFSLVFGVLSATVGYGLVTLIETLGVGRRWVYTLLAGATGALLAALAGRRPTGEVENPHGGVVFSPFTHNGMRIDSFPQSANEYLGSIAFCAFVGAILGLAFSYFHLRGKSARSNGGQR
jgi:hypothetical protein